MARKHFSPSAAALALALLLPALALPARAQTPAAAALPAAAPAPAAADTGLVYRREVFDYTSVGRPDPFRPLLSAADLGVRLEDLRLTAVVYNPNPRLSVAVFSRGAGATASSLRVRVGQRMGNLTVLGIYPRRVDVRVEEFGQSRVESTTLKRQPFEEAGAAPPAAAGSAGDRVNGQLPPGVTVTQQAAPAQPAGPLTRGGRRAPTPAPTTAAQPPRSTNPYRSR